MALFKHTNRTPRPSDKVTFVVHGPFGNLITRIKARITEKNKGIAMWKLIRDLFNFNDEDIREYEAREKQIFLDDYKDMVYQKSLFK